VGATSGIVVRGLTKIFGGGADQVRALDDVSLTIRENEFFTLLGPSGCGKTTLLRLIAGFEQPTAGEILLDGASIVHLPPFQRPVNTVFQSYALFPHMTVAQNIAFGLEMRGMARAGVQERVAEMLALVQLGGLEGRRPAQLSGGQQQRVALARALANQPKVLLLDEPLSALDLKLRKEMQIELKRLQLDSGITFVFVTHDQEEALTMSDRIAVVSRGTVRQVGSPREIYDHPAERFVADFIGEANMLEGELARVDAGRGMVRLVGGIEVPARVPQGAPASGPVTVVVRPEHAALAVDQNVRGLPAVVESAVYVGTDTQYHLRLAGGEPFTVRCQNTSADSTAFEPGTPLQVLLGDRAVQVLRD